MISIPNPCSQDFEKMTPTQRGAFCEKCSTDTFDFRILSDEQIYQIIDENQGKHICGRFTKGQLDNLNAPAFFSWKNQSRQTFQSKFLLACIIVFGLSLFSCEKDSQGVLKEINSEQIIHQIMPEIAYLNDNNAQEIVTADLLDYIEPEVEGITECEIQLGGEIAIDYDQPFVNPELNHYEVLGGAIVSTIDFPEMDPYQVIDSTDHNILADPIYNNPDVFEATAFPNPTQSATNIAVDVKSQGQYEIMLYNFAGQMVTSIHSGHLSAGRQTFEVDMSDFNSGTYIIKIISQGQDETLKVQKVN